MKPLNTHITNGILLWPPLTGKEKSILSTSGRNYAKLSPPFLIVRQPPMLRLWCMVNGSQMGWVVIRMFLSVHSVDMSMGIHLTIGTNSALTVVQKWMEAKANETN